MLTDPVLHDDWFAVAKSSDVPVGRPLGVRLVGRDVVLWRNEQRVEAWEDLCIHRGAKLSLGAVRDNCLVCPYHGWEYAPGGRCIRIPAHSGQPPPAKAQASVFRVCEQYGFIWVSLGDPQRAPAAFPELHDASYRQMIAGPYSFQAQGPRIVENFLDVGHLPIVHAGLLGDAGHTQMEDYEVDLTSDGIVARDIRIWQPDPDGMGQPAEVSYTYHVQRPLIASFRKTQGEQVMFMALLVTPLDQQRSLSWVLIAMNYAHDVPQEQIIAYQDQITAQDKPVVESQRPELLPLDLQQELHLRSDKTAIAYRRWLRQLGMTYGTA
jgi:phenylpropionate dioxygenase-like ring-hydroxylating dioxygenase large terminal subunit